MTLGSRASRIGAVACAGALLIVASRIGNAATAQACPGDNGGLTVPPGFCATIFADTIGHVRHMVVAPNGVLYVNTWSGRYYGNTGAPRGGFVVALKDSTGAGRADIVQRFGPDATQGAAGGTGIAYYDGAIYAELNDRILRYALPADGIVPEDPPAVILSGLPLTGDHPMHPFVIDAKGHLTVDLGSATNACQLENRMLESRGHQPCTELETRGGLWRYDANLRNQTFSPAARFVTGLRNGEGLAYDADGRLFATQHGRDQLWMNWPWLYTPVQGADQPAEELVEVKQGADYGWPECYFDGEQKKLVLAPEYGGDGGKAIGVCAAKQGPVAFFPAHWAPNDLLIDNDPAFPASYRGGAFIAFHGSWNRAPEPQGGYNVVFQPLKDGKAAGPFIIFADGFAGKVKDPNEAAYRPTGLAAGRDGALYISDDKHGRIWRVTYKGVANAPVTPAPKAATTPSSGGAVPPEGTHPDAGRPHAELLPVPLGATREQVMRGDRIFHGEAAHGKCSNCHGWDAKGSPAGNDLTTGLYLWGDGSTKSLKRTVMHNMTIAPGMDGQLTPADVDAVAAYVWAIGHQNRGQAAKD